MDAHTVHKAKVGAWALGRPGRQRSPHFLVRVRKYPIPASASTVRGRVDGE
jgi:hypothetical protein